MERSRGLGKAEALPVTRHPVTLQRCGEEGYFWGQKSCAVTSRRKKKKKKSHFLRKVFCELAEEIMSLLCSHRAGEPTLIFPTLITRAANTACVVLLSFVLINY